MPIQSKDVVINLVRGLNGSYFQFRHLPTGAETEPLPRELFHANREQLLIELEQKVTDKLAGKTDFEGLTLKSEDLEVRVAHRPDGDFVRICHIPTQTFLGPFPLLEFNSNKKQVLAQLDGLVAPEMMMEPRSRYFPLELDSKFMLHHYRKQLMGLQENSFWQASRNAHLHAYRFLWLRTFDPPIMIRLEVEPNRALLTTKITDGMGGYQPREIVYRQETILSVKQIAEFLSQLEQLNYWQTPANNGGWGIDGAMWILEGIWGGKYNLMQRWNPPPEDPFRQALWTLVGLAGLEVERVY